MDNGDSDIEEDLPQSDDEEEFVQEIMLGSPPIFPAPPIHIFNLLALSLLQLLTAQEVKLKLN